MPDQRTGRQHPQGRLRQFLVAERRPRRQLVLAGAARSAPRTPESSPATTRESRPAAWPSRPARTRATRHGSMPASATHAVACRRMMGTPERRSRVPCRPSALAKELTGPSAGAVVGTRPACSWGKSPFGRMGGLHYRTCVRVQGAVPTVVPGAAVVPAAAVPSTPAAWTRCWTCLLYTSDAADDLLCVDLGG